MYEIISTLTTLGNSLESGSLDSNPTEQTEKVESMNFTDFLYLINFSLNKQFIFLLNN